MTDARLSRLQQGLGALDPGLPYDQVFAQVIAVAQEILGAQGMAIVLRRPGDVVETLCAQGPWDLVAADGALALPAENQVDWLHGGEGQPASVLRAGFAAGEARGVVAVAYARPRAAAADDEEVALLLAHQLGLAVARRKEQQRLVSEGEQARRQSRLWQTLAQLGRAVMRSEDDLSLMRSVCEIAVGFGDLRFAWIGEPQGGHVRLVAWSGEDADPLGGRTISLDPDDPWGQSPAARAVREGRLCTVREVFDRPDLACSDVARAHGVRSVAAVPISIAGEVAAVLVLGGRETDEFEDEAVRDVLTEFAQDLAFGLEVLGAGRRRAEVERELRLQHEIVEQARECLVVAKVHEDGRVTFVYANPAFETMTGYRVDEMIGRSSRMLWGPRTDQDAIAAMHDVVLGGGAWSGEVYQYRKDGSEFVMEWAAVPLRDEQGRISHILSSHRDVTERHRASERIAYLAHHDALTGLPNRVLLEERLAHALHKARRHRHRFAVALLDLDEFKQVNDTLGHGIGDKLLQQLAARLSRVVRAEDTIARSGGDEFILLVDTIAEREELAPVLDRLTAALEEPTAIAGRSFTLRGSIGVAVYPEDGGDAPTLLRRADIAMYAAKRSEGARCRFFEPAMEEAVTERGDLRLGLQRALRRGEFELFYQPQVDLERHHVVGFEALLRWRDPNTGLRLPGSFLPAAEGTPLEIEIGRVVLRSAIGQAEAFARQGLDLQVAINLSPRQFLASDFLDGLEALLQAHPDVRPARLTLEITESAAVHDVEQARRRIASCRSLGLQIALDDFGTGSSSITLLQELPCDLIKIDQRFIASMLRSPESPAIIQGVLVMGHAMERQVMAEGVETPAQAQALLRLGCTLVQGYEIARPMPAREVDAFLQDFASRPPLFEDDVAAVGETFQRLAAGLGHLRWAAVFTATAAEGPDRPFARQKRLRGTCCGLGYWIEVYGRERFGLSPAFAELERQHELAHHLAAQAAALKASGDGAAARCVAEDLWRQKDDLITALAHLKA